MMADTSEERTKVAKVEKEAPEEAQELAPEPSPAEEEPTPEAPAEEEAPEPTPEPVTVTKPPEETGGYVTVTQFKNYFGVSDTYVRSLVKGNQIRGLRTIGGRYRIPKSEIARFEKLMKCEPRSGQAASLKPKEKTHAKEEGTGKPARTPEGRKTDDDFL